MTKKRSLGIHARFASTAKENRLTSAERAGVLRLLRWQRLSLAAYLLPDERVGKCYRVRVKPFVDVNYSKRVKSAHYGGLMTCASVWSCPVCSSKITERRRKELQGADMRGLSVFMVTLTLQHNRQDKLKTVRGALGDSFRGLRSGRWWQEFREAYKIAGSVAASEVTWGVEHGWHPHKHVLFFSLLPVQEIEPEEIREQISKRYRDILAKSGRWASSAHGVDVRMADDLIAQYLAKYGQEKKTNWTLVDEITKAASKIGFKNGEHYTPFELLDLYLGKNVAAGRLFIEYALTMKGAKQLVYSRGTRALLGLGRDETDEELAAAQEEDAVILASLKPQDWRKIIKQNLRGHLLEVARTGSVKKVITFLQAVGIHALDDTEKAWDENL